MREYEVDFRGQTFRLLATEEDAKRRGLRLVEKKPVDVKARPVPNKSRTAANK